MSVALRIRIAKRNWRISWGVAAFKKKLVTGTVVLVLIFLLLPVFFRYIEDRDGVVLNDWLLALIPVADVSIPIMILIWGMILLFLVRVAARPPLLLTFLIAYILLCLSRCMTIYMVPLEPPRNMVVLTDPLTGIFYGGQLISKDLFYSGHTSLLFLIYLCTAGRGERMLAAVSTLLVGILLLVQHVHYTADVVCAPFFAGMAFKLASRWTAT